MHKKRDKQYLKNYRPVSLLSILGKVVENLLCENQSGFRPSESCEYQILSIVHEIYTSFDCNPPLDVKAVFLDISKAFAEVWHDGLIYKIKLIGIIGALLKLIQSFLNHRLRRVVLNGQNSSWKFLQCLLTFCRVQF